MRKHRCSKIHYKCINAFTLCISFIVDSGKIRKMIKLGSNVIGIGLFFLFNSLFILMAYYYAFDICLIYYLTYKNRTFTVL